MLIYVAPVSGGAFPHQLEMIMWLCKLQYKPDVVLASSGGNVASYVAMAGDWTCAGIEKMIDNLYSNYFFKSWFPTYISYLPSVLKGYFMGSIYDINPKFFSLFDYWFPGNKITTTETWTGTYNKSRGQSHMFCNMSKQFAILKDDNLRGDLLNFQPYTYLGGDVATLAKVCLASAAVPLIFPSQEIGCDVHVDGGNTFSSPLTPMQDSVREAIGDGSVHIIYLSSYNIQTVSPTVCDANSKVKTMYRQGASALTDLLKSLSLQDRKCGIELIRYGNQPIFYHEQIVNESEFQKVCLDLHSKFRSLVEIYPMVDTNISIMHFSPDDIRNVIVSNSGKFGMRYWYVDKQN